MFQEEKSEYIVIGRVLKAIGLEGLCTVELYGNTLANADFPYKVFIGKDLQNPCVATVSELIQRNKTTLCQFQGVADRDAADVLRNQFIYIGKGNLPDLDKDEFYHFELHGMTVYSENDEQLGVIEEVFNYPSTDAIEVRLNDASMVMVPFTPECIVRVDKSERRVVVNKGFLEELL